MFSDIIISEDTTSWFDEYIAQKSIEIYGIDVTNMNSFIFTASWTIYIMNRKKGDYLYSKLLV